MKKKTGIKIAAASAALAVILPSVMTGCSFLSGEPTGSEVTSSVVTSSLQEDPASEVSSEMTSSEIDVIDRDAWNLILVNYAHEMDPAYEMELKQIPGGQYVDARIYDDLIQMLNDCAATGTNPGVSSGYRDMSLQKIFYDQEVQEWMNAGYSKEDALIMAKTEVAKPGTSEHHTGLAVDIITDGNMDLVHEFKDTPVGMWMAENSYKYGFILRYPEDKKHITGVIYEPWHFRYVGKETAKILYDNGLTLEEYLGVIDSPDYLAFETEQAAE